jgi:hypothetical protein
LLSIRPDGGDVPHAKNNAKRVPKKLMACFQHIVLDYRHPSGRFGIFLTRGLKRRRRPPLLLS